MLEAVIAGVIIFGFLAVIGQTYMSPAREDVALQAYQSLKSLDEQGVLRLDAAAWDWGTLNGRVKIYGKNHTVEICSPSQCQGGERPEGRNVWVGNYIISGDQYYSPRQVKLYLW